jgi:hypothetical protein
MFFLYKDVVYYHIPYNPLKEIYDIEAEIKHADYQILFEKLLIRRTEEYKSDIHHDILKYFADMDMVPLKSSTPVKVIYKNPHRSILFSIGEPYNKTIMLFFYNPNVFELISGGILKDGTYKIQGEGVDFIYLSNTLKENNY